MHVAIIMDGNRRWARKRGLKPYLGHVAGKENLERILKAARRLGINILTLYTLSLDNFKKRSRTEVNNLMRLLKQGCEDLLDSDEIHKDRVKVNFFGKLELLPSDVRDVINKVINSTKNYNRYILNLCVMYDGREELVQAAKKTRFNLSVKSISNHLYTAGLPDPDLVIRTGNEFRLSGFLLWQSAYSELYFSKKMWPDFKPSDLKRAIESYKRRERRFGK